MFGFNKKENKNSDNAASVNDVAVNAPRQFGKTSKKKNTYIIQLEKLFAQPELFDLCQSTPLIVVRKNGAETQNARCGFMSATAFPNPGASEMVAKFKALKPVMQETASTIIEYLDKETGAPVIQLFPTHIQIFEGFADNWYERLNHASRRDFDFQLAKRNKALEILFNAHNR